MAITVTATQGGNTAPGMLLRVYALTGVSGTGASGSQAAAAAHSVTLTTTETGSLVYGAVVNGINSAITGVSGTTIIDDVIDATNSRAYASFVTSSPTVTPGSVTVGSPVSYPGAAAALEILPGGTIAADASSPAAVSTTTATTLTTAAFSPPGNSLLLALAASDGVQYTGTVTMAVTNSGGALNWTPAVFGNGSGNYYAGVWTAPYGLSGRMVGTSPVLIASVPSTGRSRIASYVEMRNGGTPVYLGGPDVTSPNGARVAANTSWSGPLFPGDQLYACTASGASLISVYQTGA